MKVIERQKLDSPLKRELMENELKMLENLNHVNITRV